MQLSNDYDDIIVGAGSAGAVLAARLSEDPGRRVALVEAGAYYPTSGQTPDDLLDGNAMAMVGHNWPLTARLTADRDARYAQARVAGGGSAVGNTVAIRGTPGDYDEWAALGNPLWSWSAALPHLRAMEDDLDYGGPYHGRGGPTPIRRWRPDELTDVQQSFLDACLAAGYPLSEDHNDPASTGVGPIPSNRRDARVRVSTAMAYLWPAQHRENLTILPGAHADRVLLTDGTVRGVRLVTDSGVQDLRAKRVILAAGAIGTPPILLRSGIGPGGLLRDLGIGQEADLPGVGAGLTDQPRVGVFMVPRPGNENEGRSTGQIVLRTTAVGAGEPPGTGRFNDLYYAMVNRFDLTHHFPQLRRDAGAGIVFGVMVVARRAASRGSVTIASADPRAVPVIDLNYLSADYDHRLLAEGVRACWDLAHSPKIRDRGERVVGLDERTIGSDDALRDYIASTVDSTYNPVGTARMGPAADPGAVVDQHCAVHGTSGLYVADASVMPAMVCANVNLTVIMIAEAAAAMLRGR